MYEHRNCSFNEKVTRSPILLYVFKINMGDLDFGIEKADFLSSLSSHVVQSNKHCRRRNGFILLEKNVCFSKHMQV